jgi:hypothetical protein
LCAALNTKRLVVVEGMVLGLYSGVLDHGPGVGLETGHGASDVGVDFDDLFDGGSFKEGRGDALLNSDDYSFSSGNLCELESYSAPRGFAVRAWWGRYSNCGRSELDGLQRVFDLEQTSLRGEGASEAVRGMRSRVDGWKHYLIPRSRGLLATGDA